MVGIALIVGCFTTFTALMGTVMSMAYLFAETISTNPNLFIGEVFLLVAGYQAAVIGLDYWVIPWFRILLHDTVVPIGENLKMKCSEHAD